MKVSREQAALNRERIVDVAAKLFREKGYEGIGVADLMKHAGLTHGGFYGHFKSKEDLLTEACQHALDTSLATWQRRIDANPGQALAGISDAYLSRKHLEQPGSGCLAAALGQDVARIDSEVRPAFTQAAQRQFDLLAGLMPDDTPEQRRAAAIATFSTLIGAMVLARAVDDCALADEILASVSDTLKVQRGA